MTRAAEYCINHLKSFPEMTITRAYRHAFNYLIGYVSNSDTDTSDTLKQVNAYIHENYND